MKTEPFSCPNGKGSSTPERTVATPITGYYANPQAYAWDTFGWATVPLPHQALEGVLPGSLRVSKRAFTWLK